MSTLKARIQDDMKAAMRAKEAERLSTIRMLLAAMKQKEVDERVELDDADDGRIVQHDALIDFALLAGGQQHADR